MKNILIFYTSIHRQVLSSNVFPCSVLSPGVQGTAKRRERYTVVIVGAGAAGVGAARELTAQGINSVLILEGM